MNSVHVCVLYECVYVCVCIRMRACVHGTWPRGKRVQNVPDLPATLRKQFFFREALTGIKDKGEKHSVIIANRTEQGGEENTPK